MGQEGKSVELCDASQVPSVQEETFTVNPPHMSAALYDTISFLSNNNMIEPIKPKGILTFPAGQPDPDLGPHTWTAVSQTCQGSVHC